MEGFLEGNPCFEIVSLAQGKAHKVGIELEDSGKAFKDRTRNFYHRWFNEEGYDFYMSGYYKMNFMWF